MSLGLGRTWWENVAPSRMVMMSGSKFVAVSCVLVLLSIIFANYLVDTSWYSFQEMGLCYRNIEIDLEKFGKYMAILNYCREFTQGFDYGSFDASVWRWPDNSDECYHHVVGVGEDVGRRLLQYDSDSDEECRSNPVPADDPGVTREFLTEIYDLVIGSCEINPGKDGVDEHAR